MTLLVAVPASYAIVRFRAGGRWLPSWILGTYVAPPIVISVPVFMLMRSVGLVDQPFGLALLHMVANPASGRVDAHGLCAQLALGN
ncbi:MAG: hypothetical protein KatS3mg052_1201 [Candidatus Roseilinea sp.]|nr:MAG: hypothetical protein KatS3mg052_1201 [Candidatus Roseilinea sp.]